MTLLAKGLKQKRHQVYVLTFYPGGYFEKTLQSSGVNVLSLDKTGRCDVIGFILRFILKIKRLKPDIIYSYLTVPNIIAVCLKPFFPKIKIVWGIRSSYMDLSKFGFLNRFSYMLEAKLSRLAHAIIANSFAGKEYYALKGFPKEKIQVVHNGIDTDVFKPLTGTSAGLRKEWNIPNETKVIGMVSRIDPMKDYETFLAAASLLLREYKDLKFVVVGGGQKNYTTRLQKMSDVYGLKEFFVWTGPKNDMPSIYNSFDIFCLTSFGEGFPNVVAEAMACNIPCVVTNAGDSKLIVGEHGIIVNPKNYQELKNGLSLMLKRIEDKTYLNNKDNRSRIVNNFSLDSLILKSETCLKLIFEQN